MTDHQLSMLVTRRDEIEMKFWHFHLANLAVWEAFKRFAFEAIEAGMKRYSARAIIHRIRWFVEIEIKSADDFKINNNYSPHYARLFMKDFPQHGKFFETRELISGKV